MATVVRQFQSANQRVLIAERGDQRPGTVLTAVVYKQHTAFLPRQTGLLHFLQFLCQTLDRLRKHFLLIVTRNHQIDRGNIRFLHWLFLLFSSGCTG